MKITIEYAPHEMARIKCGRSEVMRGNLWDFHSGCHGTKLKIDGEWHDFTDVWEDHIRRPDAVAQMIKEEWLGQYNIKCEIETVYREKPFR